MDNNRERLGGLIKELWVSIGDWANDDIPNKKLLHNVRWVISELEDFNKTNLEELNESKKI